MRNAASAWRLQLALAGVGAVAVGLILVAAANRVALGLPPAGVLLSACRRFVLPQANAASILVLLAASLGLAVLAAGARAAARELGAQRRVLGALRLGPTVAIGPWRARLFADPAPRAFCAGLLRPRVYVSSGARRQLSASQLEAVVAHEAHHARRRDPLRLASGRVLARALFFLPALGRLGDQHAALAELAADHAAVTHHQGDVRPLAGALFAFEQAPAAVVGIAPERVDQLAGQPPAFRLPVALLALAALAVAAVGTLGWRAAQLAAGETVNLPLLAAQACMAAMVVVPAAAGAALLLAAPRLARRRRRSAGSA